MPSSETESVKDFTVSFHTLGCKLNFSETATLARLFEEGGFRKSPNPEKADIHIINTCSVTGQAEKKCRNIINRLVRENPDSVIVVTGCYAQLRPDELKAIEGVDLVAGNNSKEEIPALVRKILSRADVYSEPCLQGDLNRFFSSFSTSDRTRSFLKVQDGCDYRCTYCTIPDARGSSRNASIADVTEQAREIARSGCKEIVITGINTGDFGRTTGETFIDLLRSLDTVEGIERYRISSIEPNLLSDEIIEFTAGSRKFQPHFHIPLQSGSDTVLARMKRRYNTYRFSERIDAVRERIPDVFIGIDLIVGFPGETDEEFEQTYRFIERIRPSFLHIFPYSSRPGTPAGAMPNHVDPRVKAGRIKRMEELNERLHSSFVRRYEGTEALVLYESTVRGGFMSGYTENYIRVTTPVDRESINKIIRVRLGCLPAHGNIMEGYII